MLHALAFATFLKEEENFLCMIWNFIGDWKFDIEI